MPRTQFSKHFLSKFSTRPQGLVDFTSCLFLKITDTSYFLCFRYIDDHKDHFIDDLKEAVSIPSVSAFPKHREDIRRMIDRVANQLRQLGVEVEICNIGTQVRIPNNHEIAILNVSNTSVIE